MSQTRDQKPFTISEVAADWHELMIPQRTMRPSIARVCCVDAYLLSADGSRTWLTGRLTPICRQRPTYTQNQKFRAERSVKAALHLTSDGGDNVGIENSTPGNASRARGWPTLYSISADAN